MIYTTIAALAIPVGRRCAFGGTGVFGSGNISGHGTTVALVRSGPPYGRWLEIAAVTASRSRASLVAEPCIAYEGEGAEHESTDGQSKANCSPLLIGHRRNAATCRMRLQSVRAGLVPGLDESFTRDYGILAGARFRFNTPPFKAASERGSRAVGRARPCFAVIAVAGLAG